MSSAGAVIECGSETWAVDAVAIAADKGILNGYEDNTVKPQASTTHAEATTVILRTIELK
ncbi:S-layer homology domain-containing protein [Paenibacillus chartarius]|uniref:S-layer homology domain-containing protein n=1 Tax=Paenibacillus chartarius TaxID=747481 RepID=A0ABV6DHR0_9BACL